MKKMKRQNELNFFFVLKIIYAQFKYLLGIPFSKENTGSKYYVNNNSNKAKYISLQLFQLFMFVLCLYE